jgi:hypothetical protein
MLCLVTILGVSAFLFLIPLVPLGLIRSWGTICPGPELCSIGDGGLTTPVFGSLSYQILGIGGTWGAHLGHYEIVQNGCFVIHTTTLPYRICYDDCPLGDNGLCTLGPALWSYRPRAR